MDLVNIIEDGEPKFLRNYDNLIQIAIGIKCLHYRVYSSYKNDI